MRLTVVEKKLENITSPAINTSQKEDIVKLNRLEVLIVRKNMRGESLHIDMETHEQSVLIRYK